MTMYETILNYLLSMPRADAEKVFCALYTTTSAATFSTVGFFGSQIADYKASGLFAVCIPNSELNAFCHWNTTSAKNGKEGEREPRLRIRIPKSYNPDIARYICSRSEFDAFCMAHSDMNKGEAFEMLLTGQEKSRAPYWEEPDSEFFGSIKLTEATVCTLSTVAKGVEKHMDRLIFSAQNGFDFKIRAFLRYIGVSF